MPILEELPVPTGAEATAFDRAAAAGGVSGRVLMAAAGRAAADVAMSLLADRGRPAGGVVVLAGAGNNGGDGVVLARTLHARGHRVVLLVDPRRPDPDPLLHGHDVPIARLPKDGDAPFPIAGDVSRGGAPAGDTSAGGGPALIVDGLLGTGLGAAPREPAASWIRRANELARAHAARVFSLDLPSGVVADTGAVPGDVIRADLTVAFGAPKLGSLLHPGRGVTGRIVVVEIGFPPWPPEAASGRLITGGWARRVLPRRAPRTHKNETGRLLLVAGGEGMGGAAVLAARAALRTGVGMLRVLCAPEHRALFHDALPEAILPDPRDPDAVREALLVSDAVAAGPGMGRELPGSLLSGIMERMAVGEGARRLLLDADALTLLGEGSLPLLPGDDPSLHLLTPHPGEMARILEGETGARDPLGAAARAAATWRASCLLKGTPSVVADASGGPIRISTGGSSAFAKGGIGDVLTGVAGALMARGLRGAEAGALALHLTGRAADRFLRGARRGDRRAGDGLLPFDLIEHLPGALDELDGASPPTAGSVRRPLRHPSVLLDLERAR